MNSLQNRKMITTVMIAATIIPPIQPIIFSEFNLTTSNLITYCLYFRNYKVIEQFTTVIPDCLNDGSVKLSADERL